MCRLEWPRQVFRWLSESTGRCVVWSGFSGGSLNRELYTAAGVAAVDVRAPMSSSVSAFGRRFNFSAQQDAHGGIIEFSVKKPVQRPAWGVAKIVATDDRGIEVLHRHKSSSGGIFVMSSFPSEQATEMSAADKKAWFAGLLSLCG